MIREVFCFNINLTMKLSTLVINSCIDLNIFIADVYIYSDFQHIFSQLVKTKFLVFLSPPTFLLVLCFLFFHDIAFYQRNLKFLCYKAGKESSVSKGPRLAHTIILLLHSLEDVLLRGIFMLEAKVYFFF